MVDPFRLALDTAIAFGAGSRLRVGDVAARYGGVAVLVTGTHSWNALPQREEIPAALTASGVSVADHAQATGEPDVDAVRQLARRLRDSGARVVVAVGGGSVIDLAKAGAVCSTGLDVERLLAGDTVDDVVGPAVVAVPTTAGSGAEVSRGAIILDPVAGKKRGIRGRGVAPRSALVDPELVTSCPAPVTARAGFDAVSHAVETTVSLESTPVTRMLAVEALRALLRSVPRSMEDPGDLEARSQASYGAMLMGINLANSTTCLPHRLQYPIGALTRTEHAVGVAAIMPAWLERILEHAPQRLAPLAQALGHPRGRNPAASAAAAIQSFMHDVQLQPRLRDFGLSLSDVAALADAVEGRLEADPSFTDRTSVASLYEASL